VTTYADFFTDERVPRPPLPCAEQQLSIPEIAAFLRAHGLLFLGFTGACGQAYRARFPADPAMIDLEQWHQFEIEQRWRSSACISSGCRSFEDCGHAGKMSPPKSSKSSPTTRPANTERRTIRNVRQAAAERDQPHRSGATASAPGGANVSFAITRGQHRDRTASHPGR